jgi:hypothetical protein
MPVSFASADSSTAVDAKAQQDPHLPFMEMVILMSENRNYAKICLDIHLDLSPHSQCLSFANLLEVATW